ncbi:multisubunit sodium/proton antiporter, MrpE subunit [Arsukibacterium tuosuense]|uniref:Multisubunit sodium/proton antiporter, MrpE subunit n=1 Tax=Arsukibacterium tuosuense TaxID=1323745 RepID=A0A285IDZ0_9GAMM|nr:Na+/H+ antiporter subunit E [Arsukibacterium tuosuense]SNY45171.1 multisubunit sodium/proton antiporter, MrpE subunit [Arsukibacterium tuosuense]
MIFQRMTDMAMLSILAALVWAALTQNQGWWFFLPLWLLMLIWQYFARLTLPSVRLQVLPGFIWFFFRQLVLGAFDVGWRALAREPQFSPQWQSYSMSLTKPASQRLLASLISLLPGTCSAGVEQDPQQPDQLLLHVLDQHADWQTGVRALEQQLTRLLKQETRAGDTL